MSRSYKKNPVVKDHNSGVTGKKLANRAVRNYKLPLANGKAYKKVFETWDIHDYVSGWSLNQYRMHCESDIKEYVNGGSTIIPNVFDKNWWYRTYKMK